MLRVFIKDFIFMILIILSQYGIVIKIIKYL